MAVSSGYDVAPALARGVVRAMVAVLALAGLLFTAAAGQAGMQQLGLSHERTLTRHDLWRVVHLLCVPTAALGLPFPCTRVVPDTDGEGGHAVLRISSGHILVIPTSPVTGIESPELREPGAPNYFADAWNARDVLNKDFRHPIDAADTGLAVNSAYARTQDQLHVHLACIRPGVRDALEAAEPRTGSRWTPVHMPFSRVHYRVMKLEGSSLAATNIFSLLDPGGKLAPEELRRHTLVVTGARFRNGRQGFYVLDDAASGDDNASGELLLDKHCRKYL